MTKPHRIHTIIEMSKREEASQDHNTTKKTKKTLKTTTSQP